MSTLFTESVVESATLAWLQALGYAVLHGPDIAAGEPASERSDPSYRDVVLEGRLREALVRLNPDLPSEALADAYRKLTRTDAASLIERNCSMHRMLIDGVTVEYRGKDASIMG
ncbi:protein containing Restriction endonuclease, type I, EcoRI, R subunit/Type III, Res subunit, partial [mine drainage metagenome]